MPDIHASDVLTKEKMRLTPEIVSLKKNLTEGQKLRCIYEFIGDIMGYIQYDEGTVMADMLEDLADVHDAIEYCGLI